MRLAFVHRSILAVLLAAAVASPALAQDWSLIFTTGDGTQVFYDPASIAPAGPRIAVRVKAVLPQGGEDGIAQMIGLQEFDCAARTRTTVSLEVHKSDGTQSTFPGDGEILPIRPNTPGEAVEGKVCPKSPAA